VTNMTI